MTAPSPSVLIRPVLAMGVLLGGLACLRPSIPVVFHLLRAVPPQGAQPAPPWPLAVEVEAVRLPDMLQRPQIVRSHGPGSLELSPGDRWANPLEMEMQRAIVEDLALILGSGRIVAFPFGPRVKAVYRVEVEVLRCDGSPGGALTFQANWMITRPGCEPALALGRTVREEPVRGPGTEALVEAHERALAALSQDLAQRLRSLPIPPQVTTLPAPIMP